jgi:glycosyl transferase family 1
MQLELIDRLAEIPFRLRRAQASNADTWPVSSTELARIRITWPTQVQWAPAEGITETLRAGLKRLGVLRLGALPQTLRGVIVLACMVDEQPRQIALDYMDNHLAVNAEALAASDLYIKLQFSEAGYADPKIIPGGYPVTGLDYYRYYAPFRARYVHDRRIDVLGRFGYTFQGEIRRKAVSLLSAAKDLDYVGTGKKVRYSRFLREAASARLCLDLPGNGRFTHRVAEFLGIGSCLIALRYPTALNIPLVAGVHYVAVADDLSDLVDACRYYVAQSEEREKIARAGSEYFDKYLHCDQLAHYYARNILDRLA